LLEDLADNLTYSFIGGLELHSLGQATHHLLGHFEVFREQPIVQQASVSYIHIFILVYNQR